MHALLRHALRATVLAGGLLIAGGAAAHADDAGRDGVLEDLVADNVLTAPVTLPIDVGDIVATVLGTTVHEESSAPSPAEPVSTVEVAHGTTPADGTTPVDDAGAALVQDVVADNTATLPITAPVTTGDATVTALGQTDVDTVEVAHAESAPAPQAAPDPADSAVAPSPAAPTVTSEATSEATSGATSEATPETAAVPALDRVDGLVPAVVGAVDELVDGLTGEATGALVNDVLADDVITAPVTAPITLGDVTLTVLGQTTIDRAETVTDSSAPVSVTEVSTSGADDGHTRALLNDVLADNVITAPVTAPITLGDVTLTVLGRTSITETGGSAAPPAPTSTVVVHRDGGTASDGSTAGGSLIDDLLSGNVITLPVTVPVDIGDLTLTVIGETEIVRESTDPGAEPTNPGTDPTDPGTDPTEPTYPTDPKDPTDPTEPGTDPTDPTDPTDLGTDPGADPGTDPGTQPGTNPGGDTLAVVRTALSQDGIPSAHAGPAPTSSGDAVHELPATGAGSTILLTALAALLMLGGLAMRRIARAPLA